MQNEMGSANGSTESNHLYLFRKLCSLMTIVNKAISTNSWRTVLVPVVHHTW